RSCWVCFATDEDDRSAEWVRPMLPRLHQVGPPDLPAALGGREAAGQQHGPRGLSTVQRRVPHRLPHAG
ncbi:unnamed protein product, partial [Tetraodon nigroviridis]